MALAISPTILVAATAVRAESADMAGFADSCGSSEIVLAILGEGEDMPSRRATLCTCLVDTLGPQVSSADADILAGDVAGLSTAETRAEYDGYAALEVTAADAFETCFAQLAPAAALTGG